MSASVDFRTGSTASGGLGGGGGGRRGGRGGGGGGGGRGGRGGQGHYTPKVCGNPFRSEFLPSYGTDIFTG